MAEFDLEVTTELKRIAELLNHESKKMCELSKVTNMSPENKLSLARTYISALNAKFYLPNLVELHIKIQEGTKKE